MMAGPPGTYYPESNMSMHPQPNMPPPGVMMPGPVMSDVYADDWGPRMGHHRPMYMEPRNGGPRRGRPPPHNFRPDYRGSRPWRPQGPWREQGPPPMPGKSEIILSLFIFYAKKLHCSFTLQILCNKCRFVH